METGQVIAEFVKTLLDGVKEAGAFVKDQLPLVLQEYITWGIVSNAMSAAFCIIASIVLIKLLKVGYKNSDIDDGNPGWFFLMSFSGIGVIVFVGLSAEYVIECAKAIFAPRVYLIDQLGSLLGKPC